MNKVARLQLEHSSAQVKEQLSCNNMEITKEIESIKEQLLDKYKPDKIIIFGSYARGEFSEDSDLDFLIIKKNTPYQGRDRARQLRRLKYSF